MNVDTNSHSAIRCSNSSRCKPRIQSTKALMRFRRINKLRPGSCLVVPHSRMRQRILQDILSCAAPYAPPTEMTSLIAWIGADSRGAASVYFASDSRISCLTLRIGTTAESFLLVVGIPTFLDIAGTSCSPLRPLVKCSI
jgi:hypothetical protein